MSRLAQAQQQFQQQQFADALETAQKLVRMGQQLPEALTIVGASALRLGNTQQAQQAFQRVTVLQSTNPSAWNNLGLTALNIGDMPLAAKAYRQAVKLSPHDAAARYCHAFALSGIGKVVEAIAELEQALVLQPDYPPASFTLFSLQTQFYPPEQWPAFCQTFAPRAHKPVARLALAQARALHAWFNRQPTLAYLDEMAVNIVASRQAIESAPSANAWLREGSITGLRTSIAYYAHMAALGQGGVNAPQPTNLPTLWLVGDSHILSAHGQTVAFQGQQWQISSCLAMGCKLWHLASPTSNMQRSTLANALSNLPASQPCLISVGEIDCRPREGIYPHARKTNQPWANVIAATIPPAVQWLSQNAQGRPLTLCGIPFPSPLMLKDAENQADFLAFHAAANVAMAAAAAQNGLGFINLYPVTQNQPEAFLPDGTHLHPHILPAAMKGQSA